MRNSPVYFCFPDKKSYALSIRDWDESKDDVAIKHYRIRQLDNGGCYLSPKRTFASMLDLVDHYKSRWRHCMSMWKCQEQGSE